MICIVIKILATIGEISSKAFASEMKNLKIIFKDKEAQYSLVYSFRPKLEMNESKSSTLTRTRYDPESMVEIIKKTVLFTNQ